MNNKYESGKIYKIVDLGYNKCYYGSTVQALSVRMAGHRSAYKKNTQGVGSNISSYNLFTEYGVENCKIELVELYPCNSKAELEAREGFYIKNNDCVNKRVARRSDAEYYQDHKEEAKEYYEAHKEDILEYKHQWYLKNKDKIAIQAIQYQKENKDAIKETHKKYYEENKEKLKLKQMERYWKQKKENEKKN